MFLLKLYLLLKMLVTIGKCKPPFLISFNFFLSPPHMIKQDMTINRIIKEKLSWYLQGMCVESSSYIIIVKKYTFLHTSTTVQFFFTPWMYMFECTSFHVSSNQTVFTDTIKDIFLNQNRQLTLPYNVLYCGVEGLCSWCEDQCREWWRCKEGTIKQSFLIQIL